MYVNRIIFFSDNLSIIPNGIFNIRFRYMMRKIRSLKLPKNMFARATGKSFRVKYPRIIILNFGDVLCQKKGTLHSRFLCMIATRDSRVSHLLPARGGFCRDLCRRQKPRPFAGMQCKNKTSDGINHRMSKDFLFNRKTFHTDRNTIVIHSEEIKDHRLLRNEIADFDVSQNSPWEFASIETPPSYPICRSTLKNSL